MEKSSAGEPRRTAHARPSDDSCGSSGKIDEGESNDLVEFPMRLMPKGETIEFRM